MNYEKVLGALWNHLKGVNAPPGESCMQSAQLHLYRAGKISLEQYLDARMSICLARMPQVLDKDEVLYVQKEWHEYVSKQLLPSGKFAQLCEALLNRPEMGDNKGRGVFVNQKGNAAEAQNLQGSEDLNSLKRGEITIDEYIERRMEFALADNPAMRLLPESRRAEVKEMMREHFLEDPVVRHYAHIAAGVSPEAD